MTEAGYRVRGHVQGVGFRWWTRSQARALGLTGSVRNCPDGTVEVRARGSADGIAELRLLLAEGPPGARVEMVENFEPGTVPGEGFQIVR
jgi:acylphosphatase